MTNYKLDKDGSSLIQHFESLHDGDLSMIGTQPKMDCSGWWTEGWGRLMLINGKPIKGIANKQLAYDNITIHTIEEADAAFLVDVTPFENKVNALNLDINQSKFDAIISFVYNCGFGRVGYPGGFLDSTLLARIKAKALPKSIELAFLMWNKSGGVVYDGLIARRMTESVMFNTGELLFYSCHNGILAKV